MKLRGEEYLLFELNKGDTFYFKSKLNKRNWEVISINQNDLLRRIISIKIKSISGDFNIRAIRNIYKNTIVVYLGNSIYI